MTCITCKHALPVNPLGTWARYKSFDITLARHCGKDERPHTAIIGAKGCQFDPSQWEKKA